VAYIINLPTYSDDRGSLTVIEKILPFDIKRVFFIYNPKGIRGGHRHKKTVQCLVCCKGECKVYVNNGKKKEIYHLNSPNLALILEPEDWHTMFDFSEDAVLLVLASDYYDKNDYIYEEYKKDD
jgi:dTDP-4-dehydrorhamnose 3,5-epimerase-like enzyme